MPVTCKIIEPKNPFICYKTLNKKIDLLVRKQNATGYDYYHNFTAQFSGIWAMCKTLPVGTTAIDGSNVQRAISHAWYTRYISGVTAQHWIGYNSRVYKIVSIQNINQNNEWLVLNSIETGDPNIAANRL